MNDIQSTSIGRPKKRRGKPSQGSVEAQARSAIRQTQYRIREARKFDAIEKMYPREGQT